MIDYCTNLSRTLQTIRSQVKEALTPSKEGQLHDLQPGDWIMVKDYRRRAWHSPRWSGPFQVLLVTSSAVKVAERASWIHACHCKRAPPLTTDPTPQRHDDNGAGWLTSCHRRVTPGRSTPGQRMTLGLAIFPPYVGIILLFSVTVRSQPILTDSRDNGTGSLFQ